jgi:hypothetical protein
MCVGDATRVVVVVVVVVVRCRRALSWVEAAGSCSTGQID